MPHVIADRVLEASTSSGSGPFTLAGAVLGFRSFAIVCALADTVPYYIEAVDDQGRPTGEYEFGLGTYSAANQLTRTTIRGSSNGGLAVSFAAGNKLVGLGVPAPNTAQTRQEWRTALGLTTLGNSLATVADQAALQVLVGLDQLARPGDVKPTARDTAESGWMILPTAPSNVSRVTYASLFAAIGTKWGAGDGATTFGLPYVPEGHAVLNTVAGVGTATVGEVISHSHTINPVGGSAQAQSGPNFTAVTAGATSSGATGGSANLPAGVKFRWLIKL
ncbi:tail fiber protein [Hydrogenophaga sp. 2FB]|uniref:tail fiber protein n=1 Tax=Hydrogenophaga sp. 2FB TaxID=2502187 RepID=UPI0010F518A9|nr:tail fiber protein [Hydrogenophaga sp. 2FB]